MPRTQLLKCHDRIESDDDAVPHDRLGLDEEQRDLMQTDVSKFNRVVGCSHGDLVWWDDGWCENQRRGHQSGQYRLCQSPQG